MQNPRSIWKWPSLNIEAPVLVNHLTEINAKGGRLKKMPICKWKKARTRNGLNQQLVQLQSAGAGKKRKGRSTEDGENVEDLQIEESKKRRYNSRPQSGRAPVRAAPVRGGKKGRKGR